MHKALIASILMVLVSGHAFSQGPPPRNGASSQQQQSQARGNNQQTSADERGTDNLPLIVKVLPSADSDKEAAAKAKEKDDEATEERRNDIMTGIIAGATFLQAFALIFTVIVLVRTARRQLRAYVLPESANLYDGTTVVPPIPATAGFPSFIVVLKNSGHTPAYRVISWVGIDVLDMRNANQLVVAPLSQVFQLTLGPGGQFTKSAVFGRALTAYEIADIVAGVRAIYVYGRVEYRDAFKRKRYSNFRLRYVGQYPPIVGATFNFSESGNSAN